MIDYYAQEQARPRLQHEALQCGQPGLSQIAHAAPASLRSRIYALQRYRLSVDAAPAQVHPAEPPVDVGPAIAPLHTFPPAAPWWFDAAGQQRPSASRRTALPQATGYPYVYVSNLLPSARCFRTRASMCKSVIEAPEEGDQELWVLLRGGEHAVCAQGRLHLV